jgi:ketosteroid isomerase-like protein
MKMMKLLRILMAGAIIAGGTSYAWAQDAQAEKTIVANERAISAAFAKGDAAAFKEHVAGDGWAIDPMMGLMSVADFLKGWDAMVKDMKIASWDITDSKVLWVDANTAVHSYKWTGQGTMSGQPIPSPTLCSTVWTKKSGKWSAVFHQETLVPPPPKK